MIKPNPKELINYRIRQAKETVSEVKILIENNLLKIAVNRIYYGMFYMVLALATKYNYQTSKHQQLIGWFNKNFVKTGKIDPTYGKMINDAFENRADSDYGVFVEFSAKDLSIMSNELESFIKELEKHIMNQ